MSTPNRTNQPASPERVVRVFISSTFRDMQAERDQLLKFVFPELRKLCESRGVTLGEVDLRWGVTTEQAAEGKVLPICLEEIRRSRPFFIGLLGERYGWVPESIPPDVIEREPWLREHVHDGKSVTELEILHGVLRNPAMEHHAYFYFRDPDYLTSLPEDMQATFAAEDAESAGRLNALKDRIRASGMPVRECYRNPKVLGRAVRRDLRRMINRLFPEGSEVDPLDRDAWDHEAYANSRAGSYICRQSYYDALDAHAGGNADMPLVIVGEPGSGKSALLANWAARWRTRHAGDVLIWHFVGASAVSSDWVAMLRRIMGEIKRKAGIPQEIPDKAEELRRAFPNWLHLVAAKARVVLVLDGLNQLEDRDGAPDLPWLPPGMPEQVRLIVSTLPGRTLTEATRRGWPTFRVEPLETDERTALITGYLGQYAKALDAKLVARIVGAPQSANPLFLRTMLDELRVFGVHESLTECVDQHLQAPTVADLFGRILARWEQDYAMDRPDLVRNVMSLLWAARMGLSETELLEACGSEGCPLPHAQWSPLRLAAGESIISRSGLLAFAHDELRRAVRQRYLASGEASRSAHAKLADYFARLAGVSSKRRYEELPWQYCEAGQWTDLFELLKQPAVIRDLYRLDLIAVMQYWTRLEANSSHTILDLFRCVTESPLEYLASLPVVASLLMSRGHTAQAAVLGRLHVDVYRRLAGKPGCQPATRATLGRALGDLAIAVRRQGKQDEALALRREEEQVFRDLGLKTDLVTCLMGQCNIFIPQLALSDAMRCLKEAEGICRDQDLRDLLAQILGDQAIVLHLQGDTSGAEALHVEESRLFREVNDVRGLAASLSNQALTLFKRARYAEALALAREQEAFFRRIGDAEAVTRVLRLQAMCLDGVGEKTEALGVLEKAEPVVRSLGEPADLMGHLSMKAGLLLDLGARRDALVLLEEADGLAEQHEASPSAKLIRMMLKRLRDTADTSPGTTKEGMAGDPERRHSTVEAGGSDPYSMRSRALALRRNGHLEDALAVLHEQEQLYAESGQMLGLEQCLWDQVDVLRTLQDRPGTLSVLSRLERGCRTSVDHEGLGRVLDATAETLCSAGNLGTAEACWKEQASLCQRRGDSRGLAACSQNLGHVAYQQGRFDEALRHYKEQERLNREIADEGGIASALANQGAAGTKLGLASAAALLLEAHRLLPDDAAIPYNLACCCVRSGELDEAEAWIKKAIEIAGDSAAITREALADDDLADIRPRLARF